MQYDGLGRVHIWGAFACYHAPSHPAHVVIIEHFPNPLKATSPLEFDMAKEKKKEKKIHELNN